ncbi:MAG: DUF58 domain-containing protein [Candidatus Limnocylindrales bacterium]
MSRSALVAVGLIVAGALARAPGLILLAVLLLATAWLSTLWSRHGLDRVRYERQLANDRAVWGDSVDLAVTVRNEKLLPLAWLQADDYATAGMAIREHPLSPSDRPGFGILRNVWTLAPFEEVRRRVHIEALHRGRYEFTSVRVSVADLFGRGVATRDEARPATLLIRPRTVAVRSSVGDVVSQGTRPTRLGLVEDPSLFAGVRPFQAGDPRRRVHERATARVGRPVSKRFEPSTARQVVVALDVQTHDGPAWLLEYDDDLVESLAVAAASLARRLLADGAACGLAVNGRTYSLAQTGFVPARAGRDQLTRIADMLARTSSVASVPFGQLLSGLPGRLESGARVISLSGRDPTSFVAGLRRLRWSGFDVRHIALGPAAMAHAAALRRLGIDASHGRLDPDWRTSDAFTIAG